MSGTLDHFLKDGRRNLWLCNLSILQTARQKVTFSGKKLMPRRQRSEAKDTPQNMVIPSLINWNIVSWQTEDGTRIMDFFFSSCKVRYFRRYKTFWCISKLKIATAIWWHYLSNLFFNIHSSCKHHLCLSSIHFQLALFSKLGFLKQPSEKQGFWHFLCGWRSAALVCLLMECKVVLH